MDPDPPGAGDPNPENGGSGSVGALRGRPECRFGHCISGFRGCYGELVGGCRRNSFLASHKCHPLHDLGDQLRNSEKTMPWLGEPCMFSINTARKAEVLSCAGEPMSFSLVAGHTYYTRNADAPNSATLANLHGKDCGM